MFISNQYGKLNLVALNIIIYNTIHMPERQDDLGATEPEDFKSNQDLGSSPERNESEEQADWIGQLHQILLQRGQRFVITGKDSYSIDSTPQLSNDVSIGGDGELVDSFGKKFEQGFEGWKPGQKLHSRYIVQRSSSGDGVQLLVADSVVRDIRYADVFEIDDLPEAAKAELLRVGIAEVDADIEITGPAQYEISNSYRYRAKIDRIYGIQPPFDGDFKSLVPDQQVLVEGKVLVYERSERPNTNAYGHCLVELPNGTKIPIVLWNGYLVYEGGSLDVLNPPYPIVGDAVQINCAYGNPGERYGRNDGMSLFAYFTRSTYLQEASAERKAHHDQRTSSVQESLQAFNTATEPREARRILSQIMRAAIITESSIKMLGLTVAEKEIIQQAIESKFSDPEDRPINFLEDTYTPEEINRVWGVDVYSMSRREFFEFCMGFASGEANYQEPGGIDYPYRVFDMALSREQQLKILTTAVRKLSEKVIGKKVFHTRKSTWGEQAVRPGEITDPDYVDWDFGYLFDQSMSYLSKYSEIEVAEVFVELVVQMDTHDKFRMDQDHAEHRDFHEFEIFNSMERNVEVASKIRGTKIAQVNQEVLAKYQELLPLLRRLSGKMQKQAWNNDGIYTVWKYVDDCVVAIERAQDNIRKSKSSFN